MILNEISLSSKRITDVILMRDIGKIEKRLQQVEYYTSLSLLEAQTQGMRNYRC